MTHTMRRDEHVNPLALAAPLLLSLGLFYSSLLLPPLGLLAPAPLYYALAAHGHRTGVVTIAVCGAVALVIGGTVHALFYLVFCGLLAWTMAECHARQASLAVTIGAATVIPYTVGAVMFVFLVSEGGAGVTGALTNWAAAAMDMVIESYESAGADPELIEWVKGNTGELVSVFVRLFASLTFISALITVVVNYMVIRAFSIRYGWGVHDPGHAFATWQAPDYLVWILIAGGFGYYMFDGGVATVSLNALLIAGTVYFFQGIAVIHYFFQRSSAPAILRVVGYFIIFSQPLLLAAAAGLGLVEMWADIRKIGSRQDPDKPNDETHI